MHFTYPVCMRSTLQSTSTQYVLSTGTCFVVVHTLVDNYFVSRGIHTQDMWMCDIASGLGDGRRYCHERERERERERDGLMQESACLQE